MPYANTLLPSGWRSILNSNMITDPIYVRVVLDPDGENIDLTDWVISIGSISHKKSIYPDDRLNAWDASDVTVKFLNDSDKFVFDGDVVNQNMIGKRVHFYLTTEAVAEDLPIGIFLVTDFPTLSDDYTATWVFKSKQKELMDKPLYANSIRVYKPGYVYPDVWHLSQDYSGVNRSDESGNEVVFDQTDTSDNSDPFNTMIDIFPYPVIGGRCPLGEWSIEFINGKKNVDSEDPTYDDTREYRLSSPDGTEFTHSGDFVAVHGWDTTKSATMLTDEIEEIFIAAFYGKIADVLSLSSNKIYYKNPPGAYDEDEHDYSVGDSVYFNGVGEVIGLEKELVYEVTGRGWDSGSGYYITVGAGSLSGLISPFKLYPYEKPSDTVNQSSGDTEVYDSYVWGKTWIDPVKVQLILPKIKSGYYFKEGDTITFKTVWRSPAVDDPTDKSDKDTIGKVAISLIADNRVNFGEPYGEENWIQDIDVDAANGGIDILECDSDSFDLMDENFNNILVVPYFDDDITVWKAVEVIAKHLNCTVFVDKYTGKYTMAVYRPKSADESIFRLTGYNAIQRVSVKSYGIFRSIQINYDWQDGEFKKKLLYDYANDKFGRLTSPVLELYCPGFRDTITPNAVLRGIARKFASMWGDGLAGFDVDLVWNLAVGMNPNERFYLTSDRPTVDTLIELDSFEFGYDANLSGSDKKKVKVTGFDVTRTFNEYAFYGIDTYNGGKVYW